MSINNYLNYYDITTMEEGTHEVYMFLNDWFIRKCLWSSKSSIKENAASIKKFYQCMNEKKYITDENYNALCKTIKDNMDVFLESMKKFDNGTYYGMFY